MMQDNLLLEGKVSKVFLTFCIPAILSMETIHSPLRIRLFPVWGTIPREISLS